jgi:CDP-4-dehydro-6-deoxyglucose reductase, E1
MNLTSTINVQENGQKNAQIAGAIGVTPGREKVFAAIEEYVSENPIKTLQVDGYIPVSGKIVDKSDMLALVEASMDMWLTAGRFSKQFEATLAKAVGARWSRATASGSAANLLAFATFTSPSMGERQIKPGDEIISVAAGFPTTVAPIVQHGCIPVFVDVDQKTHNVRVDQIESAISPKTKAIMIAHTLGNPFDLESVMAIAKKHNLFVIEDCCDALGATFAGQGVGTFGDMATLSFYPAHHITMGEGGAIYSQHANLLKAAESLRDWGRDCWCPPGKDNTCKKRFDWNLGSLPEGYDHKYIYSHLGYNLKITDMQAAIGLSQLAKVSTFIAKRRQNHAYLTQKFLEAGLDDIFHLPEATPNSEPSWFGFMVAVKANSGINRRDLVKELEARGIGTRLLFAGNLTRQPAFKGVEYRIAAPLENTDFIMNNGFWLGVWPGLEKHHLDRMVSTVVEIVRRK